MKSLNGRQAVASGVGRRVLTRCNAFADHSSKSFHNVTVTTFLAAGIACLISIPAYAESDENLTPYQRRQAEAERRRELMRQTREAAVAKMDSASAPQVAIEEPKEDQNEDRRAISEKMKADMQSSKLKLYEDIAAKSAKAPVQEPETPDLPFSFPSFGDGSIKTDSKPTPASTLSFFNNGNQMPSATAPSADLTKASADTATPPARVMPASPTPSSQVPKPAPAPVKETQVKSGKRKGPLPLWASELAVLGFYAAMVASVTKFGKQTASMGDAVSKVVNEIAKKAKLA